MMKKTLWTCGFSILLAGSVLAATAHDNADDTAYTDGWQNADNGGSGFSQWYFSDAASSNTRARIESSTVNGGSSNIGTNNKSFCLDNSDNVTNTAIEVYRNLDDELYPGETLSLDMDVNWRNGTKGISIRNANDSAVVFEFLVGGDDYYVLNAATGNGSIGNAYSDNTQFHIELEQTSIAGGVWRITRSGGISTNAAGTYSGRVSSMRLFSYQANAVDEGKIYFNNFDVSGAISVGEAGDDKASDTVYDDGWQDLDNGGFWFSPWYFGEGAKTNTCAGIISSTWNDGSSSINSGRRSFRLLDEDNSGVYLDAVRFLETDLLPGQTFSIDLDVNWRGGYKGIRVQDSDDYTTIFRFEVGNVGAGDDYTVLDAATGNGSIGSDYTDNTQFHISMAQTSGTGGVWNVLRSGGTNSLSSGTYVGTVSRIQLYTVGAGSDAQQAIYYNNLAITNEAGFDYFTAWTESYLLGGGEDGHLDDPDGDNLSNLAEFGLGSNPTNSDPSGAVSSTVVEDMGTNWIHYVYNRRKNPETYNLDYQIELTPDLVSPSWTTNGYIELPAGDVFKGFESVTNRIPTTNNVEFVTVKISVLDEGM